MARRAALHSELILRIQRLGHLPVILLRSIHIRGTMLQEQVFSKVTTTGFRAIAMCVMFTKALLPINLSESGKVKDKIIAYTHSLHRLIDTSSSFLNSVKKSSISLTGGPVSESKVVVPRVWDQGVRSPP